MTDDTDTTNALTLVEAKHAELQSRLDRAREQVAANRSRAHENAFDAEARDSTEAKRLSTKLIEDSRKLQDDIEHRLEPAVAEAARRVTLAKAALAKAAFDVKIERALERVQPLAKLGAVMDKCFVQIVEAKMNAFPIIAEMNSNGVGIALAWRASFRAGAR